jgi:hypothetical protein
MTIQDLAAIGEFVGGVAVLATLIYLTLQVRQTNVATHRNMYAQAATSISEFWLSLARDPELYQTFAAMLRAQPDLSDHDRDRGYLVMDAYMSLMESYFLHNRQYGERLSQQRWGRILQRMFGADGAREYWRRRRASFHDDFADYVDDFVEGSAGRAV